MPRRRAPPTTRLHTASTGSGRRRRERRGPDLRRTCIKWTMRLDDLGLFLRVAHSASLSEAARQLDQTPASVSARLKRIEEELGVRLVERTTRALRLTPEGERFLQTCDAITATWARGRTLLRHDARAVEGRIHIAAPTDTSTQFLADWVGDYTKMH